METKYPSRFNREFMEAYLYESLPTFPRELVKLTLEYDRESNPKSRGWAVGIDFGASKVALAVFRNSTGQLCCFFRSACVFSGPS